MTKIDNNLSPPAQEVRHTDEGNWSNIQTDSCALSSRPVEGQLPGHHQGSY